MDILVDIIGTLYVGVIIFCLLVPLVFIVLIIGDLFYPEDRRWRPWTRLKNAVRRAFEFVVEGILSLIP